MKELTTKVPGMFKLVQSLKKGDMDSTWSQSRKGWFLFIPLNIKKVFYELGT